MGTRSFLDLSTLPALRPHARAREQEQCAAQAPCSPSGIFPSCRGVYLQSGSSSSPKGTSHLSPINLPPTLNPRNSQTHGRRQRRETLRDLSPCWSTITKERSKVRYYRTFEFRPSTVMSQRREVKLAQLGPWTNHKRSMETCYMSYSRGRGGMRIKCLPRS
jgi:hypothetical protein